jgi:hypothetical protein
MPEPTTAVVEVPPEVKERQEVDAYIEKRKEEKSAPPPEVKVETTTPEPPPETAEAVKEAVEDATDDYIRRRNYESKQKRKPRGGVQAKIDELTKKTAELEAKVAEPPKVETPTVVPPVVEAPKPAETAKEAPKMADYTDIDKYNTDLALWAAAQTKVVPTPVPISTPAEPPKPDPQAALRKEEFDKFLEAGKKLIVRFPDFNETLNAAHIRGLTMSEQARIAITKLAAPEVAYWLAKPENDLAARNFMKLDDFQQVIEVGKIAERLTVKPSDFISNAPPPGPRLNGTTRSDVPLNEITDTDEYIRQRRQAKRAGIRR